MQEKRAARYRQERKKQQQKTQETIEINSPLKTPKEDRSNSIPKDQSVPEFLTENIVETMDGKKNNQQTITIRSKSCCKSLLTLSFIIIAGKNVENCNDIQVAENLNIVAIDPGVRTGWSWYSPSKGCGWFGNLDIIRVFRLSLFLDDLISRTTQAPPKKRNSMKRAQARLQCRIQNLVEECHKKVTLWLKNWVKKLSSRMKLTQAKPAVAVDL
ncbi:transposase [Gigaspora margarita]|uniref:Transposase n=1 Tax=Gigaspora margarita TaxID=4874 RepID=A0A8H4EJD6_GIGMA|nr:transposase [Gigaspora margarita]